MRLKLLTACCLLLISLLFLLSCTPQPPQPTQTSLYIYRLDPPAFVEFSDNFEPLNEIPYTIPLNCSLFNVFSAPIGQFLVIELSCPNGQTVLFWDTESGSFSQPVTGSDSHFLAWSSDGKSAYLKVDSLGDARVIRVDTNGNTRDMEINPWTYDLASQPNSDDFVFTFSGGLGYGSEMTLTRNDVRNFQQIFVDRFNYLSFARYSPNGKQIAFIKIPDSPAPFTVGELWVMDSGGSNARKLAEADAGHGYAANWSPDGKRIAFVRRENSADEEADQSSEALVSNIYLIQVESGEMRQITSLTHGRAETPHWSPDGNTLAFNTVLDGRMEVQIADLSSGAIRPLMAEAGCCPAWMRK